VGRSYDNRLNIIELKKILFLLAFTISMTGIHGQTFAPIGARWYYSGSAGGMAPTRSEYFLYESETDTIVANHSCKKISRTYFKYQNGDTATLPPFFVYLSTDTVFYYNTIYSEYFPLYIFNVSPGDTMTFHSPVIPRDPADTVWYAVVTKVDSLVIGSDSLQRVWTNDIGDFSFWGGYTEKIGSLSLMEHQGRYGIPEGDGPLRCYSDPTVSFNFSSQACDFRLTNSTENLQNTIELKVFPNPVQDNLNIQTNISGNANFKVLNSIGQEVKKGIIPDKFSAINISGLPDGYYTIEIMTGTNTLRQSFIVQKQANN
jgi:hypothetical protein